jgi:phage shock protein A
MTPSIAGLILFIVLNIVAPLLLVWVFMNGSNLAGLLTGLGRRISWGVACLFDERARQIRKSQTEHRLLTESLGTKQRLLNDSMAKEQELQDRWRAEAIEHSADRAKLALQLEEQRLQTNRLWQEAKDAQEKVDASYARILAMVSEFVFIDPANRLTEKSASTGAQIVTTHVEERILEREREAEAAVARRAAAWRNDSPVAQPSELDREMMEVVDRWFAQAKRVSELFNVVALVRAADPSIDRAYRRVVDQLAIARKVCEHSTVTEDEIEEQIAKDEARAMVWQTRADTASQQGKEELADNSLCRKEHSETSIVELSAYLKILRRRNFAAAQMLFRSEGVVRRLYVVKLLLSALPGSMKYELSQFKQIADAACRYLKLAWQHDLQETPDNRATGIEERVAGLENRILMAYIRLARREPGSISHGGRQHLEQKIVTVSPALAIERDEQQAEFVKWDQMANQALAESKEFVHAVASQRRDQYAAMLKTTRQALEVLEVTLALTEPVAKDGTA